MAKAEMECTGCGRDWTYSGLSKNTCFCPYCGSRNRIPKDAHEVLSRMGVPY